EEAVGLERLHDEVLRAELDRLDHLGLLAERRAHQHAGAGIDGHDLGQGLEAGLLRHRDVEHRQLRLELLEAGDRLVSIAGLADPFMAAGRERVAHDLSHEGGVVDYQYTGHQSAAPSSVVVSAVSAGVSAATASVVSAGVSASFTSSGSTGVSSPGSSAASTA